MSVTLAGHTNSKDKQQGTNPRTDSTQTHRVNGETLGETTGVGVNSSLSTGLVETTIAGER